MNLLLSPLPSLPIIYDKPLMTLNIKCPTLPYLTHPRCCCCCCCFCCCVVFVFARDLGLHTYFIFSCTKKDILQLPKYNIHVLYLHLRRVPLAPVWKQIYHGKYFSSQWFLGSKPITTFTTKFVLSVGPVI